MSKKMTPYKKNYPKQTSREVDTIQDEINRIFEQHLSPFGTLSNSDTMPVLEPNIEIEETPTAVTVSAELPGMDAKDIDVNVSADGYLTISGEKQSTHERSNQDGYYFSERSYGMVQRTVALPTDINLEKVSADFEKGVLKINIPKLDSAAPKMKKVAVTPK